VLIIKKERGEKREEFQKKDFFLEAADFMEIEKEKDVKTRIDCSSRKKEILARLDEEHSQRWKKKLERKTKAPRRHRSQNKTKRNIEIEVKKCLIKKKKPDAFSLRRG
jgi:hypothetical protein